MKMNEDLIFLTKEEALSIAKIKDNQIHCFINPGIDILVGADHSKESFLKDLETAKEIEVGGEHCRKMKHALVLWQGDNPYFFEHDEDKLVELLMKRSKNENSK